MNADQAPQDTSPSPLTSFITQRIADDGPMHLGQFMALALGHPAHGYYQQAEPFGSQGDFTTAPEISQCFGEMIGLWLVQTWRDAGSPSPFNLVELGPGRGTLMADALRAAAVDPNFATAARLAMVETSTRLRAIQQQRLNQPITHLDHTGDLTTILPAAYTLIVANEFFDALPIRQFVKHSDGWRERRVTIDPETEKFAFALTPLGIGDDKLLPPHAGEAAVGSFVEVSPASHQAMADISALIKAQGGAALIIDYGYGKADWPTSGPNGRLFAETLQALKDHKHWPVLDQPGTADITAHVDFNALDLTARNKGLRVAPLANQGDCLQHLGIAHRLGQLLATAPDDKARENLETGTVRLVDPNQMGHLFKVLSVCHTKHPPLAGLETT